MAYRAAGPDTGDMTKDALFASDVEPKPPKRNGICAPCIWFKEKPLSRWQFIVLLLFGILTPLWVVIRLTGSLTGDIIAGVSGFFLAIYGANHFRILLGLKEQVDRFGKNNREFKTMNAGLRTEVSKLTKATEELSGVADRLKQTTKGYEENVSKFRALDEKLGKLADDNIAGLEKLQELTKTVQDSIQKELIQHQRDIVMRIQESMEMKDDKEGMTNDEYNAFINYLPKGFQIRFQKINFNEISGD
eukprot:870060_1